MMRAVNHKTSSPKCPSTAGPRMAGEKSTAVLHFLDVVQKGLVEIDASPVAVVNSEATPLKLESTSF